MPKVLVGRHFRSGQGLTDRSETKRNHPNEAGTDVPPTTAAGPRKYAFRLERDQDNNIIAEPPELTPEERSLEVATKRSGRRLWGVTAFIVLVVVALSGPGWVIARVRARHIGVPSNQHSLASFRFHVARYWYWTLRRRSQKTRLTWAQMQRLANHWLPPPTLYHPYPLRRLGVITYGRSRMR